MLSQEAEIAPFPSGVTATALTGRLWPASVCNSFPLSRSHTFKVLSSEVETARFPSGVTATALTALLWPASVCNSFPLARSHTFRV